MKEQKDIEGLKKTFLDLFSSTVQVSSRPLIQPNALDMEQPSAVSSGASDGTLGASKEININVNIDSENANASRDYSKKVSFDSTKNLYNITLKKNETPVEKIINSSTTLVNSLSPLTITNLFHTNSTSNLFSSEQKITKVNSKNKKKKSKQKEGNVAYMSFITEQPYNFFTEVSNYRVTNSHKNVKNLGSNKTEYKTENNSSINNTSVTNLSENPKFYDIQNHQSSLETNQHNISTKNEINGDRITKVTRQQDGTLLVEKVKDHPERITKTALTEYTIENGLTKILNQTSSTNIKKNETLNLNNKTLNVNEKESNISNLNTNSSSVSNNNVLNTNSSSVSNNNVLNTNSSSVSNNNVLNTNSSTIKNTSKLFNNNFTNNTESLNSKIENNSSIVEFNTKQLSNPSYQFLSKESYLTIDPNKGESLSDVSKLKFKDLQQRLVNRIQARTIVSNRESKILIPAFSGGGIVNSSTVAKITSSPALVGESGSEMVLPTKMPNQTNKVSSNPKDVLMGNETTEIKASTGDNLSKTIEKNMELKKEASTSEALSDEKEKDENKGEKANNRTSSTKDTTDNLSRNPPGQAMIHTNLPSSTVEKLKTNLRSIPVWRTQHM
jgi:hypothetical protein